jgi:uncharacterized membrane protein YkoI
MRGYRRVDRRRHPGKLPTISKQLVAAGPERGDELRRAGQPCVRTSARPGNTGASSAMNDGSMSGLLEDYMPGSARPLVPVLLAAALTAACTGGNSASSSSSGAATATNTSTSATSTTSPSTPTQPSAKPTSSTSSAAQGQISEAQARRVALAAAGTGAKVRKVERDDEDSRPVYKYEVAIGKTIRKISVDRATGKIVKNEVDNDND